MSQFPTNLVLECIGFIVCFNNDYNDNVHFFVRP